MKKLNIPIGISLNHIVWRFIHVVKAISKTIEYKITAKIIALINRKVFLKKLLQNRYKQYKITTINIASKYF